MPSADRAGLAVLRTAEWWYDAADISNGDTEIANRGTGTGTAQLGSTTGADTNDPTLLPFDGEEYFYCPGTTGNYLRNDAAAVDSANPTTIIYAVRVYIPTGGFASTTYLTGGNSTHRQLRVVTNKLEVKAYDSVNAASIGATVSSVAIPVDNGVYWLRGTLTLATGVCDYHYSADQVASYDDVTTWTQIGTSINGTAPGANWALTPTAQRLVGAASTGSNGGPSSIYGARWIVDGEDTFDWSPADGGTITRSTSGLRATMVKRAIVMGDGTDDYLQLVAGATPSLVNGCTVIITGVSNDVTSASAQRLWSSESAESNGFYHGFSSASRNFARLGDSVTAKSSTSAATARGAGTLQALAARHDSTANTVDQLINGYADATGTDSAAAEAATTPGTPRVLARGESTSACTAYNLHAFAQFDQALTDTEIANVGRAMMGGRSTSIRGSRRWTR